MHGPIGLQLLVVTVLALGSGCPVPDSGSDLPPSPAGTAAADRDAAPQVRTPADAGEREPPAPQGPLSKAMEGGLPPPPDVAAPPADAERSASGLAWRVLKKGRGGAGAKGPGPFDVVKAHYTGWTTDGINFDSSVVKGEPLEFRLNDVIKGWTEGLQLMSVGEKRRFWIPVELAYGNRPGRPRGMLVFDVELLSVVHRAPPLPPAPEDVAAPPADAERTASGLASRVLAKGRGTAHPEPTSSVTIAYTAWTTEGRLFRSTLLEGRPQVVPLDRLSSKGLSEGVQLMVEGEKRRLWIPEALAYKASGGPAGTVVMDIELLEIQ